MKTYKIIQLNIWQGALIREVMKFLNGQDADIICMQEVYSYPRHIGSVSVADSLEQILSKTTYFDFFFSPRTSFELAGDTMSIGNAIISKYPFQTNREVFTSGSFQHVTNWDTFERNSNVNAQFATIKINDKAINVINHHGYHEIDPMGNESSTQSIKVLIDEVKQLSGPVILCGDMNVIPESPAMKQFNGVLESLTETHNIPNTLSQFGKADNVPCDHILVSEGIDVKEFSVSESLISDHKALILEFSL